MSQEMEAKGDRVRADYSKSNNYKTDGLVKHLKSGISLGVAAILGQSFV